MTKRFLCLMLLIVLVFFLPAQIFANDYPPKSAFHISVATGSSQGVGAFSFGAGGVSVGGCFVTVSTDVPVYFDVGSAGVSIGNNTNVYPPAIFPASYAAGFWPDKLTITLPVRLLPGAPVPYWMSVAVSNGYYYYSWWEQCDPGRTAKSTPGVSPPIKIGG